jgi:SagB-type dehydrogenase family enzyme
VTGAGPADPAPADPVPESPGDARAYHRATKHSWTSVRSDRHTLDWANKPFLFKVYPDVPTVPLPREVPPPALPALEAIARGAVPAGRAGVDLTALAQLLFFSAGLTKRKVYPGGETMHFRAAASTGALYQTEVYVVAGAVAGLEPGVYHFSPGDFTLRRLRAGDHRAALAAMAGRGDLVAEAPVTLVLTAIHWRNTWKYRARAFRHFFWDAGTLLANLLATAVAGDVPARILLGFADAPVNALLGVDAAREGSLALVPLGRGAGPAPPSPAAPPLALASVPLSPREVDYPLVRAAYEASALPDGMAAQAWLARGPEGASVPGGPEAVEAGSPGPRENPAREPSRALGETILRRGSTREFRRDPVAGAHLAAILDAALRPLPLDLDQAEGLVETYLLVHAVDGLPAGAYAWDPGSRAPRLLKPGAFRREGGALCLEQPLGADASVVAFFLSDLDAALRRWGSRGYRAVNLAAGLLGGRLYLGAYSVGLGATGLTFYDDDVVRFFEPEAAGQDAIFVTALGSATRSPSPRGLPAAPATVEPLRPGDA